MNASQSEISAPDAPASVGHVRSVRESVEEYGRGIVGGLLFSLPLLYTMEIWWAGFLAHPGRLLAFMAVTFLLLLGYNRYAGLREDANWIEVGIDSVEEIGIGLLLSALVMFLLGRIAAGMPSSEIIGKIVVESMTVAIGVSVGTAQLGGAADEGESDTGVEQEKASSGESGSDEARRDKSAETEDGHRSAEGASQEVPDTVGQLVLAFCGAVLFAANVAPTEEILLIGVEATPGRLLGLALLSLLLGTIILLFSGFLGADRHVRNGSFFWAVFGVVTSYANALIASALMLWFFQRFDEVPLHVAVAQMVVLAFPAMLGASAGRLLIQ